MKTYFSDIIPKIQKFSQKLDNLTLLTNQHWVVIDEIEKSKNVYIFRQNNELLISKNGKVEKARWEYLGHNTLLIDGKNESYLFKHGFFDENILALKIDGKAKYVFLVNETKFHKELNSIENIIEFLKRKYIEFPIKKGIENELISKNYSAPSYQILSINEQKSLINGRTRKYLIKFEDGIEGKVYLKIKNGQAFYKAKPDGLINVKYTYKDIKSCISAIHYFKKYGKELETNLLDKF